MSRQNVIIADQAALTNALLRPLEEYLTALRKGAWLLKHGRYGKPKLHYFRLVNHDAQLAWRSANGQRRHVDLARVQELRRGQTTDVFRRNQQNSVVELSFSLIYSSSQGDLRSLDLICPGEDAFSLWFGGIKAMLSNNPALEPPPAVMGRAVGGPALPPKAPSTAVSASLSQPASHYKRTSPAAAADPVVGPVAGRVTGDIGTPIRSRTPGDLWVWGSRTGLAGTLVEGGSKDKKAVACFLQPHLVPETKQLDVLKVAVGSRHAALITYSGDLYTWGDGSGGKLGHGMQEDVMQPLRLPTLWGMRADSVRCNSAATACLTDTKELYTWGDGSGGVLGYSAIRQYIPRRVDLPAVVQVSLGPFHAGAVTQCGRLFTWGDGLACKLGHGDAKSTTQPRQVEALAHLHVLQVACGFWHTAAIAGEIEAVTPSSPARVTPFGTDFGHITSADGQSGLIPQSGDVYTWGGVLSASAAGKKDTHKGCLGTGDLHGRKLPTMVLEDQRARAMVAGLNFTALISNQNKVYQAGELAPNKSAKWSACTSFEPVGGSLERYWTDDLSAGTQHCAATVRAVEFRRGIPYPVGDRMVFTWGKGQDGQLGTGSRAESAVPVMVQGLQGKKVLQVACGANYAMAVCEHNTRSEDVEELAMLQEAKDFFKQRFNRTVEAMPASNITSTLTASSTRLRGASFAQPPTAMSAAVSQLHAAPPSSAASEGSRVQGGGAVSLLPRGSRGEDGLAAMPRFDKMSTGSRPPPRAAMDLGRPTSMRSFSQGGDITKSPSMPLRRFASVGDAASPIVRISDSNHSLQESLTEAMSDPSSTNFPQDPPPLLPLTKPGRKSGSFSPPRAVDAAQSESRIGALEARIAKLEILLAQRTTQNDALTRQLALWAREPAARSLITATSTAATFAITPASQESTPLADERASLQQQQALVMRRLQEAADKEAANARLEAELNKRASLLQAAIPANGNVRLQEAVIPKADPPTAYSATAGLQLDRLSPPYTGVQSFAVSPDDCETSQTADTPDPSNIATRRSSGSSAYISPAASARDLSSLFHATPLLQPDSRTASVALSSESPFQAASSVELPAPQDGAGVREEEPLRRRPTTSERAEAAAPAASSSMPPLHWSTSPPRASLLAGAQAAVDGEVAAVGMQKGDAWSEEIDKGVYLNFEVKERGTQLTRIRFSRRHFSKDEAEQWYKRNRMRIAEQYSRTLVGGPGQLDDIMKGVRLPGRVRGDSATLVADATASGGGGTLMTNSESANQGVRHALEPSSQPTR